MVGQADRRRFGYMPEERGLYPGMLVGDQLEYLGRLHGMSSGRRRCRHRRLARAARRRRPGRQQGRDAVPRQPAARPAGGRAGARARSSSCWTSLWPAWTRPGSTPSARCSSSRPGPGCCVLFSSHQLDLVEDLCESVTIIDHGRLVVSGAVDDLATSGPRRLVVRVEGDRDGAWARGLAGVKVSEVDRGRRRLVLDESVDSDAVLRAAMAAGRVTEFVFERRRLSEVFREALGVIRGHHPVAVVVVVGLASVACGAAAAGRRGPRRRPDARCRERLAPARSATSAWWPGGRSASASAGRVFRVGTAPHPGRRWPRPS